MAGASTGRGHCQLWPVPATLPSKCLANHGDRRVNINTATQEELESVPGNGQTRAAEIIAGRPWASVDDLERLSGIGPLQVEQMRPFLRTEGTTEKR